MPTVGKKHFPYTDKGMKAALAFAEKTGQRVKVDKKGVGGMIKKYAKGGVAQPVEYDESTPKVGGERSAWFPEGQFLGMDIPEGSANIANILGGIALGGPGGAGRKSLHGLAKNVAAKRSAMLLPPKTSRSLADDILKSDMKPSDIISQFNKKDMIPLGQMGKFLKHDVWEASRGLIKQQKKIDKLMKVKNSSNPPLLYKKVNEEIYKLGEMKKNVDRVGRAYNPNVYNIPQREVGEFTRVSRSGPSEVIPAAIRGETSRRMGSEGYQEGGMLKGKSHKQGGIAANVGNEPIEMEGGEFIVKKDSAKKLGPDILNYINKNGTLPRMSNGGEVNPYLPEMVPGSVRGVKDMGKYVKGVSDVAKLGTDTSGAEGNISMFGALRRAGDIKQVQRAIKDASAKLSYKDMKDPEKIKKFKAKRDAAKEFLNYAEGGEVNPYMADIDAARRAKAAILDPTDEENKAYRMSQIRKWGYVPFGGGLRQQRDWRRLGAIAPAQKRMRKAKAEAETTQAGSGNLSMFGRLKHLGHIKEASKAAEGL